MKGGSRGETSEEEREEKKKNTRGISSAALLGSACCHGNSSEARRAADRQIPSFLISASLYVSHPDISGQLILVPGCICLLFFADEKWIDSKEATGYFTHTPTV